ncbi:MAG: phosphoenolpyruvate--protein phosphotransferase [Deltaproteobacteria bacterium]|nr:phosphoenolpyruvate--protein phosphotransferase [Deltaproteobacteria bacterium]
MAHTIRLQGIPAAPGIAIAKARSIDRKKVLVPKFNIEGEESILIELNRIDESVEIAREQMKKSIQSLKENKPSNLNHEHGMILQTHMLLLSDMTLIDTAKDMINSRRINAEWALSIVSEDIQNQLSMADNEYLAMRTEDIEFVTVRILRNLLGHTEVMERELKIDSDSIIVTIDLSPAETAQMLGSPLRGFVTEKGTQISHTSIMAQALGIPAVVGVPNVTGQINPGDLLIIDGQEGVVIINPDEDTIKDYEERSYQWKARDDRLRHTKNEPAVTKDGQFIQLSGNIELPGEAPFALDYGAQGIGLYRTEFLYMDRDLPPSMTEQIKIYSSVIKTVAPKLIAFRTFDLGADKMPRCFHMSKARNPALGMRAIRIGLRKERELLRDQIKAIIIATSQAGAPIAKIMFPLISGVEEIRELKEIVTGCTNELIANNNTFKMPELKIGCMVELPSAVFISDILAKEVDFFSIGTNDLIQYMLGIDRVNDDVAYLYSPYHPAALRALKTVITAADNAHIPVSICGGAAGEPQMTPLLVGLGLKELSMAPNAIPYIKASVKSMTLKEAKDLTDKALELTTAEDIKQLTLQFIQEKMDLDI